MPRSAESLLASGGCFRIGPRLRVRITGPDRIRYLGGQLTIDARKIAADRAMEALLLTAKGKLCAHLLAWAEGETVVLESDPSLGEDFLARVSRYAVADQVDFEELPAAEAGWHVFGVGHAGGRASRRFGLEGFDVPERPSSPDAISPEEAELLRILKGAPKWGAELDGETLPHEAGLDKTCVDFHKGCYVGQEVVSRVESAGRANRTLRAFAGDFEPLPGALLAGPDGSPAGKLTSASPHFGLAGSVALGYLSRRTGGTRFRVCDAAGNALGECQAHEIPLVP